jgi:hypothetical protein
VSGAGILAWRIVEDPKGNRSIGPDQVLPFGHVAAPSTVSRTFPITRGIDTAPQTDFDIVVGKWIYSIINVTGYIRSLGE